eukprot:CAMPEP_0117694570 /NCGR_PEP_ID=MMETSP0804-20121206/27575_1 /TAXON_ID=1074897 /ORGANISM="Tetraselmis astigmatica, Strain CCMP880" /LENGTH=50 /DNA_ID=CAMNT_0005508381 /DNA_START=769 /DNA_END=921 /DNA_ORIENTATION=-
MAQLDDMIRAVRENDVYKTFAFRMRNAAGELVEHVGAWLLCDGTQWSLMC